MKKTKKTHSVASIRPWVAFGKTHRSPEGTVRHSFAPKGLEANSPRFQPGDRDQVKIIKPRRGGGKGIPSPLRGFNPL
ncbi:MAG: hypothetical protein O2857_13870, partial [Planctomycetota bacterium]|nr:hypothetical protein [Planctomycetota bacterium]